MIYILIFFIAVGFFLWGRNTRQPKFRTVKNQIHTFGESQYREHIEVDGVDYLFTKKELKEAEARADKNLEDYV